MILFILFIYKLIVLWLFIVRYNTSIDVFCIVLLLICIVDNLVNTLYALIGYECVVFYLIYYKEMFVMKLSEKLSKELGMVVVFSGDAFEIFKDNKHIATLSMLQALSLINQMTNLGLKGDC